MRLIDPACGSGHFLLGAFRRLDALWAQHEPGTNPRDRASRVLDQVAGVDLNPFAVAIARFRLCVAALRAAGVHRLADAPAFEIRVAAGDSLLHGPRAGTASARQEYLDPEHDPLGHVYRTEDAPALRAILGRRYHVVVGNPPYITPKDKALNSEYRKRFGACHRKYSLAVPFTERLFDLAHASATASGEAAGFVGMITANSFMKREFGKKLIEKFVPRWDLTHVVDTSGAYIPGHGTPTVLLFGRHRPPVGRSVRAVMGIRGEPAIPADPAKGLVWSAIVAQIDQAGSENGFVSVSDLPRERFSRHPWSMGGGGAAELKEILEKAAKTTLGSFVESVGFMAITGEDEAFVATPPFWRRYSVPTLDFGIGDAVRDWQITSETVVVSIYDKNSPGVPSRAVEAIGRLAWLFWNFRTNLKNRLMFGKFPEESGLQWHEYRYLARDRFTSKYLIAFAFVGTHNHFVLERGNRVFKQSAPVIKLRPDATEEDHLRLLGLLNSSTACFWMKQVFHNKGSSVDQRGARQRTAPFEDFWEHDGTKLKNFPFPDTKPLGPSHELDALARQRSLVLPASAIDGSLPSADSLRIARTRAREVREQMIALQEELDWRCYRLYGVTDADLCLSTGDVPAVRLGERAFEIILARKMVAGEVETKWFERHRSKPVTEIPARWPAAYRALVQRRIETIETNANVALIEQPEYKRRWNDEPWEAQQERALRGWLLDRLEAPALWSEPRLTTTAALADRMRDDAEFLQVAALYAERPDFDVAKLVARLVEGESVPLLPVLRYKPSGLGKRDAWERTWALQRIEDAIDARVELPEDDPGRLTPEAAATLKTAEVGAIPVPPRYASADFRKSVWWRLRGKLDVPKERFVSLPGCERDADPSLVVGWAGWNALQQSQAVAGYFSRMREQEGWTAERLAPLLAALLELLPWVRQYHNAPDPEFDVGMGDYFEAFIDDEARALSLTREAIRAWAPPAARGRRAGRRPRNSMG